MLLLCLFSFSVHFQPFLELITYMDIYYNFVLYNNIVCAYVCTVLCMIAVRGSQLLLPLQGGVGPPGVRGLPGSPGFPVS